jgi:hypothetical protein
MANNNPTARAAGTQSASPGQPAQALDSFAVRGPDQNWRLAAFLLVLAWLLLAWPWISGNVTIPWDAKAHFYAQIVFLAQSIHNGESPFWAPYVFAGHPQVADPQSMLYSPPHLLLAALTPTPSMRAFDAVTLLGLLFGAFGVLGFARDRRWHIAAGLIAAIAFAYGGSAGWRNQHTGQIFSMIYFPWALWMLERAMRLHSVRSGASSGFFAALVVLDPDQVAFLSLVVLAGYVIADWMIAERPLDHFRRSLKPLASGALVGLAIILVPTMMVLHFAGESNRPNFSLVDAEMGSLHPSNLLTFAISNLFGTIGPADDFWGAPSVHWPFIVSLIIARNMSNFYMGLIPFFGILFWLTQRTAYRRRMMILAGMFLLMVLYALGKYTPVFGILYHMLPGVSLFRRPADSLFLVGALGSFLAGFGINHWLTAQTRPGWRQLGFCALVVVLAFLGGVGMAIWLGQFDKAWPELLTALGFTLLSGGVLALARLYGASRQGLIAALIALILVLDLSWNIRPSDSTGLPPSVYDSMRPDTNNPTVNELRRLTVRNETRRDRVELTGLGFEWPNLGLVHGLENTLGYNPLRLRHFTIATGAGDTVAGHDQHRFAPLFPSYRSPLAALMGLRFIALPVPIEEVDPSLRGNPFQIVARTSNGFIYENPDTYPRVMLVGRAEILNQDQLVKTGEWPSTDFAERAFVEPTREDLPQGPSRGAARLTQYGHGTIRVQVEAPARALLVLNDVWHPWWFAEIDGNPARILRTNGIFRGVIVPAGAREVVFRFQPIRGLLQR